MKKTFEIEYKIGYGPIEDYNIENVKAINRKEALRIFANRKKIPKEEFQKFKTMTSKVKVSDNFSGVLEFYLKRNLSRVRSYTPYFLFFIFVFFILYVKFVTYG